LAPKADIPIVQISLQNKLDPEEHYKLGVVASELRSKGIMILGSGAMYHNIPKLINGTSR
jgi:4,5-DOPA dioxygenase extradiol